jgi:hypothetical protein
MAPEQASRAQLGANMPILVSDCSRIDDILPIALAHQVGIEVQEFVSPDNIDENGHTAVDIKTKLSGISPRGLHGPFSDLIPGTRDRQIQAVTRSRFQQAHELASLLAHSTSSSTRDTSPRPMLGKPGSRTRSGSGCAFSPARTTV